MLGGLCVGMGRIYNKTNNVLLSAGILFVAAGERKDKVAGLSINAGSQVCRHRCILVIGALRKKSHWAGKSRNLMGHCQF